MLCDDLVEECSLEVGAAVSRQEHDKHVQGTVKSVEKRGWKVKMNR